MELSATRPEWAKQLAGGFAFQTAPFAMHPADQKRAKLALTLAQEEGVKLSEFLEAARTYLEGAQGWPTDIAKQLKEVRKFASKKLADDLH
jgi:hypothetical protein